MILSMTGFGSATAECSNKKFTVEIKSLNSKQLDLAVRLPQGYRMAEQPCTVEQISPDRVQVVFDQPQRAVTPGQAVVLYDGDVVVGGGTIL